MPFPDYFSKNERRERDPLLINISGFIYEPYGQKPLPQVEWKRKVIFHAISFWNPGPIRTETPLWNRGDPDFRRNCPFPTASSF